jgi:pimeloyl-ACP methyl ester carboxylesterase
VSLALLAGAACARTPSPRPATPAPEREQATSAAVNDQPAAERGEAASAALPPSGDAVRLVRVPLVVPGFGDAVVIAPFELGEGKPLLVAAHGAGDAPDWQCGHWASITAGRFVVLCPRGLPLGRDSGGYYFPDHFALEREVLAAVDALKRALGPRLLDEGGVYTGYSQGATMGALMVVNHGRRFPHLMLIEGGSGDWAPIRNNSTAPGSRTARGNTKSLGRSNPGS